jgi:uncharacterized membrane protein required for colicin V production
MSFTDIITLICIIFLVWRGSLQGFVGSLLGPLGLIIASIVSVIYYAYTKNIAISLCIGLFGPFLLTWLFRFILHSWNKMTNPQKELSFLSQLGGALLSLAWGMTMLAITVLLLVMIPPFNKPLELLSKDIHSSLLYGAIKPFDTMAVSTISPEDNIQSLSQDKRIQDLLHDPQITDAINRKDYSSLMSNPKITAIMQDPQLIKRMMSVYRDVAAQQKLQQNTQKNSQQNSTP